MNISTLPNLSLFMLTALTGLKYTDDLWGENYHNTSSSSVPTHQFYLEKRSVINLQWGGGCLDDVLNIHVPPSKWNVQFHNANICFNHYFHYYMLFKCLHTFVTMPTQSFVLWDQPTNQSWIPFHHSLLQWEVLLVVARELSVTDFNSWIMWKR